MGEEGGRRMNEDSKEDAVVRLNGLPWSATAEDVTKFFDGVEVRNGRDGIFFKLTPNGLASGEAYVEFASFEDLQEALTRHNDHMGRRYIEVYEVKRSEMEMAMKNGPQVSEDDGCVRLRGLPYVCSKEEIMHFFAGLEVVPNGITLLTDFQGRLTGEAYVQFRNKGIADKALEKNKEKIGHRYIDIFRSNLSEVHHAQSSTQGDRFKGQDSPGGPIAAGPMAGNRPAPYDSRDRFGGVNTGRGRGNDFGNNGGFANGPGNGRGQRSGGNVKGDNYSRIHCVHMRGLPYRATENDIADFFRPQNILDIKINLDNSNRPSGEADVAFFSHEDAVKAMAKNRDNMKDRYIELFLNSSPTPSMESGNMGGGGPGNFGPGGMGPGNMGGNRMGGDPFSILCKILNFSAPNFPGSQNSSGNAGFNNCNNANNGPGGGNWGAMGDGTKGDVANRGANFNSGPRHCIHMRGMPYRATESDIAEFFEPLIPTHIRILHDHSGRSTGKADVAFSTHEEAVKAMSKDKDNMKDRYIELFLNSTSGGDGGNSGGSGGGSNFGTQNGSRGYGGYENSGSGGGPNSDNWFPRNRSGDGNMKNFNSNNSVRHIILMRGMPYKATAQDIADFFQPFSPINILLLSDNSGRPNGKAEVDFSTHEQAVKAMSKDKDNMEERYIELFLKSNADDDDDNNMGGGSSQGNTNSSFDNTRNFGNSAIGTNYGGSASSGNYGGSGSGMGGGYGGSGMNSYGGGNKFSEKNMQGFNRRSR